MTGRFKLVPTTTAGVAPRLVDAGLSWSVWLWLLRSVLDLACSSSRLPGAEYHHTQQPRQPRRPLPGAEALDRQGEAGQRKYAQDGDPEPLTEAHAASVDPTLRLSR